MPDVTPHPTFLALLRGINIGGRNKIVMAQLRSLCTDLGWDHVQSYIQSGNLVFTSDKSPDVLETELEQAIHEHLGLSIPVMARSAQHWLAYLHSPPFPEALEQEPHRVMLAVSKQPPAPNAVAELSQRARNGESIHQTADALWIHFPEGVGKSKLSPALLDKIVGSSVTLRNWLTVRELGNMAQI